MLLISLLACRGGDDTTDTHTDDTQEPCETSTWYADADGDGYGGTLTIEACEQPEGFLADSTDCDDLDPDAHPDGVEICDGVDNDCDGELDEESSDLSTFYSDLDGDGFGDPAAGVEACAAPSGAVSDDSDCDDGDASVFPGAPELCGDGRVNDCDGDAAVAAECRMERPYTLAHASSVLYGAAEGEEFGWALAVTPDIDGDGSSELLVGAYQADERAGRVDVGGVSIFGEADSYAGSAVAGGDLDGDGVGDVVVGARRYDANRGAVYLVSGPSADTTLSGGLAGEGADDRMGFAVAAGDVNGDGLDDLIASATRDDTNASNAGAVYIWLGPATGSATKLPGPATEDGFAGYSLAVGDLDGDGTMEVLSGSTGDDTDANNGGAVFVSSWGDAALGDGAVYTGTGQLGRAVASGDVDGDGLDEVIAGADGADQVLVAEHGTLTGPTGFGRFVGSWDADGDGVDDVVVGSLELGALWLWYGPVSGSSDAADASIEDDSGVADSLGRSAVVVEGSLAVGANRNDDAGDNAGAVYLFSGYGL